MVAAPDNLPADLTSFVGRRQEITEVRQLLATTRLVTLTGVGGVGKTRLALRVARDVRRAFADGVFLVELAALQDPALLPHALIEVLKIPEQSARAPMAVLGDYLRHRQVLLVLDGCEHLLEAAARLSDTLLRSAADLRILATSRQALMIDGEHVHHVAPLPVPDPEVPVAGPGTQYPALALFAERAAAVVPGFKITPDNEEAITRLCRRLEGIPLAIELAAVRLRALTVHELADRLASRLDLLTGGSRTAPARHQTLTATIDWSYDLCTPTEQTLWARASIFAGSFTLEAVEGVCTDDSLPPAAVLDAVTSLTSKSIFAREEHGRRVRFRMLETIREYGQARLQETGTELALRRRHRDWYLRLVERGTAEWVGPMQEEWATTLQLEHANLRTALEFCLSQPEEVRIGLHMAGLPWFLQLALGSMTESRHWLERALQLDTEPSVERARALCTLGFIALNQGDPAAGAILEEGHALARQTHDKAVFGYALHGLGVHAMFNGDVAGAVQLFHEALDTYERADVPADPTIRLKITLSTAYLFQDDLDEAFRLLQEARSRCEQRGDRLFLSYALWGIGFVKFARGELDEAAAHLREALRMKRPLRDNIGLAFTLDLLAWTTVAKGEGERAAVLLGGASQLWQSLGAQLFGSKELMARREQFEDEARRLIGDKAFDAAFVRGSELAIDEILAFACQEKRPAIPQQPRRAAAVITRREREIAELVASGLSNKEIAASLVISPRTAEGHVEHILAKLGFNSRAQIAAWVAAQRPPEKSS